MSESDKSFEAVVLGLLGGAGNGGGGGGTSDYDDLTDKPQINSVTLSGNKSASDLGLAPAVEVVVITDDGAVTLALNPDVIYEFAGTLTALTITLNAASAPAHYHFRFDSGSTAASLTLPQTVVMPSGFQVEANKHYEIDILDGYGVAQSW